MNAHERHKRRLWEEHLERAGKPKPPKAQDETPTYYDSVKADPEKYREMLSRQAAYKKWRRNNDPKYREYVNRQKRERYQRIKADPKRNEEYKAKRRERYAAQRARDGKPYNPQYGREPYTPEEAADRARARSRSFRAAIRADPERHAEDLRKRREAYRYRMDHDPAFREHERERAQRRRDRIKSDPELLKRERERKREAYRDQKARVPEPNQAENVA